MERALISLILTIPLLPESKPIRGRLNDLVHVVHSGTCQHTYPSPFLLPEQLLNCSFIKNIPKVKILYRALVKSSLAFLPIHIAIEKVFSSKQEEGKKS